MLWEGKPSFKVCLTNKIAGATDIGAPAGGLRIGRGNQQIENHDDDATPYHELYQGIGLHRFSLLRFFVYEPGPMIAPARTDGLRAPYSRYSEIWGPSEGGPLAVDMDAPRLRRYPHEHE